MISPYTNALNTLPSQMIPYSKKIANKKKWAKDCVNTFEKLGRLQYRENLAFLENYEMVNGQFFMHHYTDNEGTKDMISLLREQMEVPTTLRHYDIIGKIINNLVEKYSQFPDVFRVEEQFESNDNEYTRAQTSLMHDHIKAAINAEIQSALIQSGLDPSKKDFASEEEAMAYFEEVQKLAQAKTPPQIQEYMSTKWQSQGEIWGSHQLTVDKRRFKWPELEKVEIRDMLFTDRCFRHYYLTGDAYDQETWNPVTTFLHISPEVQWVQNGNYVGRNYYATAGDIVQRYAWKMKKSDLEKLDSSNGDYNNKKTDRLGFPYNIYAPFEDYQSYVTITNAMGYDPINKLPVMTPGTMSDLTQRSPFMQQLGGLYLITEVYWRSQSKTGKVVYIDPETGQKVKAIVDEFFVVPEDFEEVDGDFYTGDDLNTVYWTYRDQIWQGTKIANTMSEDEDAIYIDLKPCEFQFKGDYNPFGASLPVCGRIFNNRNAKSMAFVDFCKPHQVGYNMCMNQLYQLLEKEEGKFMVWDAAFFNNLKDWGGEDSWEKIAFLAKELGHVFGDTSPQNMKGANPGNQLPKAVDMELGAQIMSRANIAVFFENRLLGQLGISPQSMGDVGKNETVGGVETAKAQTQLNIQKYYTDFFEYKQRCLTMDLDIAQYVQAKKKDVTISYTISDAGREYISTLGTSFLLRNIMVFIVDSQELLRQMDLIKQWFLQNNTANVNGLDVLDVIRANSPATIQVELEKNQREKEQRENMMMQQQKQAMDAQNQVAIEKENRADSRNDKDNETKKEVAYINTFSRQKDNLSDTNSDSVPDVLEFGKFNAAVQNNNSKLQLQQEANRMKGEQNAATNVIKTKELSLKEKALKQKTKHDSTLVKVAVKNKNKYG